MAKGVRDSVVPLTKLKDALTTKFHAPTGLALIYLSVFIDMFGGLMAVPVMPYLILSYGGDSRHLAYASAGYQFAAVFATPLTGKLSDKYGRRPFFILGFLGSAGGFLTIAMSGTLEGLLAGRMIGGLFSASMPLAQAYISDTVPPAESGKYRARLGSVFACALIFAPGFGGGLSQFGNTFPFYVSSAMAMMGALLAVVYLKEPEKRKPKQKKNRSGSVSDAVKLRTHRPLLHRLFVAGFLGTFGFRVIIMMLGLWVRAKFEWGPGKFGFLITLAGCVGVFANLALYTKMEKRYGKHGTCTIGALIAGAGWACATASRAGGDASNFTTGPLPFVIGLMLQNLGNSFYNTSYSTLLARYASADAQGSVQGTSAAISAIAGFCGPLAGGFLFRSWDYELLPLITVVCYWLVAVIVYRVLVLNRALPEHHRASITPISSNQPGTSSDSSTTAKLAAEAGVEVTGGASLALTADERTELISLRQRVQELEAERSEIEHKLGDILSPQQMEQIGMLDGHNHSHYH